MKKLTTVKLKKKLIIALGITAVLGIGFGITNSVLANQGLEEDKYTIIKAGSNINKINVKGEVKSENTTNVYSNVSLAIKEVKVDVGDRVKVRDILVILDTSKLEDQIRELEATITTTDASNDIALKNAKSAYDNALALSSDENNSNIKSATTALNSAKLDYENKQEMYKKYTSLHDMDAITDQELKEYEISFKNSKDIYDKCTVGLDNIKAQVQLELTTAKNNYDVAKVKAEDNSQHISLENLKKELNNAVIKSPVDGIISVKNASVGNSSSGVLFEIKDEDNINVTVDIKEVDIEKVKEGQKAEIKTDSTGDDIIDAQVISVKPIAKAEDKNALNLSNDSNDKEAEYEAEIKITNPKYNLKIGMKAQADIILDEKDGVYIVSIESVIKDKDDNDCLYIANKQGKDYVVKQIPITKGTESDLEVEVFGQDLSEGVIVLKTPSDYEVGSTIKIKGR